MPKQTAINLIRSQFQATHQGWLEPTVQGVTPEQAHWQPPGGCVAPIGAQYAHHVVALDFLFLASCANSSRWRSPPSLARPA